MRKRIMHTISTGPRTGHRKQRRVSHWQTSKHNESPRIFRVVSCHAYEVKAQEHNQEDKHESKWKKRKKAMEIVWRFIT